MPNKYVFLGTAGWKKWPDNLENHLMRELALAEREDVLEVGLQHVGLRVLGDDLEDLLVYGSLESVLRF
jgi:hypothetical protein